ncbi:FmdB family zinc ribbon protein [Ramlibacter sp. PS3R-8]|uniref:FmdB family zinc ribbon protein n=1 Tax=Ramlibacter sp. PS3R-8 TaxID=3133437 RepID=UPI0030A87DB7
MPIYAYKCGSCGHAKDVLQKISDTPLSVCPACGAESFTKQLTAAGFQLKGSGWYVTDFKSGNNAGSAPAADKAEGGKTEPAKGEPAKTEPAKTESAKTESAKSEPAPAAKKTDAPSASSGA